MGDNTQYIQQMLDSFYPQLNNPASGNYYLPNFIANNHYDPYGPFDWNIGQLTDKGLLEAAAAICPSIDINSSPCGDTASYITAAIPPNYPTLSIAQGAIGGLRNAVLLRPIAQPPDGMTINAEVDFGTLTNFPQPITIAGNFTFVNYCCCSNDGSSCSGPPRPETGTGNFSATLPNPVTSPNARGKALMVFKITDLAPGVLNLAVQSVSFVPPLDGDGSVSMAMTINITSIPKGANPQSYSNQAEKAFNSAQARQTIIASINATLMQSGNLTTISKLLTNVIDGYLRDNHQYPFDGSSFAI